MLNKILRYLREKNQLTQQELADKLNLSRVRYNNYETGKRNPDYTTLQVIADFYGVSTDYLLGNTEKNYNPISKKKGIKIPVLGKVVAGVPIEAVTDIIDYEEITEEMAKTGDYFALQVTGSSMEPRMLEGDVVIVRKQPYIESGEIAIVLVNGCDATIKKIIKQDNGILLVASNAEVYQPTFYGTEDIEKLPVSIIGKVVELRGKF